MIHAGDLVVAKNDGTVRGVRTTTPRCISCGKFAKRTPIIGLSQCCGARLVSTMNCKPQAIIGVCLSDDGDTADVMLHGSTSPYEPGMICKFSS